MKVVRWVGYVILVGAVVVLVLLLAARTTSALDPVVESSTMLKRLSTMSFDDSSINRRIMSAEAGLRSYLDRPILGWGPENFLIAWGRHYEFESGTREIFDQAHSKPIEELTTKGAVGLISYLLIWCAMGLAVFRSFRAEAGYQQLFVVIFGVTLIAYFVQNMFLFDTSTTVMLFCVLAAFTVAEEQWLNDARSAPSIRRSWLDLSGVADALRTPLRRTLLAAVAAVVAIASVFLFNFKPYSAAEDIALAKRAVSWEVKLELMNRGIESFPGLANYPRRELVDAAALTIKSLPEDEFRDVVDSVADEARRGLEAEPENWRLMVSLARFYQAASEIDESYADLALKYTNDAAQRAPAVLKMYTASGR